MCNHNYHGHRKHWRGHHFGGGFDPRKFEKFIHNNPFFSGYPAAIVDEQKSEYIISLQAPGYQKEDFKISLKGNTLTIAVERDGEFNPWEMKSFGERPFKKHFELNDKIDSEKIAAEYTNGILKITLGKKEAFHTEDIEINIA